MKFIHAADLHLDSPFEGLKQLPDAVWQRVYQSPFKATTKMVDYAIEKNVDFVLLAGDLYDQETQSVSAQLYLKKQLQRLLDAGIAVYLSYGNHDYHPVGAASIGIPEGVVLFGPEVTTQELVTRDQKRVSISGFSYDHRWLEEDMVPLFPNRGHADYHIGLLHGSLKQGTGADHYAPFELQELLAKRYDYWALGHIHKPQMLAEQPPVVYAGTIQGRHKNEDGEHGFQLVGDDSGQLKADFIPVSTVDWVSLSVVADDFDSDDSLIQKTLKGAQELMGQQFNLISLTITNIEKLPADLLQRLIDGSWQAQLDDVQRQNVMADSWIYEVVPQPTGPQVEYSQLDAEFWSEAKASVFTPETIQSVAEKLMRKRFLAKHLESPSVQEAIANQAENLLLREAKQEENDDEN